MATNRIGKHTLVFSKEPRLASTYTLVGTLEGEGPHALDFDQVLTDDTLGQQTPEKSERLMLEIAVEKVLQKANSQIEDVQFFIAGDLLNQIISSTFSARTYPAPFLGIYGACSTFCQALGLGAALLQGDLATQVLFGTASHYQTAERQFRYPIELNVQHVATNQHTVTGAAAGLLNLGGEGPRVTHATFGSIVDWGIKDANDMGSAMAPAAYQTLLQHMADTERGLEYYDIILTGDLGKQGSKMLRILLNEKGVTGLERIQDGGASIYSHKHQVGAGGSGSACVAVMTLGYLLNKLKTGKAQSALVIATGALLSSISTLQGETIPCIAHAIALEA